MTVIKKIKPVNIWFMGQTIEYIDGSRDFLQTIEEDYPHLFSGHNPDVQSKWGYYSTDQILKKLFLMNYLKL